MTELCWRRSQFNTITFTQVCVKQSISWRWKDNWSKEVSESVRCEPWREINWEKSGTSAVLSSGNEQEHIHILTCVEIKSKYYTSFRGRCYVNIITKHCSFNRDDRKLHKEQEKNLECRRLALIQRTHRHGVRADMTLLQTG